MSTIELVPLNLLQVSALNVRKTNAGEDIPGLADDIFQHGLIHNLAAHPELGGLYGVFAGGRRLRALWHNRELGRIPADWPVPVRLGTVEQAREISLAENVHKLPMNPADEFEAYAKCVEDHAHEDDPIGFVARRFQKTRRYIEQRLRLAALAPEILDALRADEIRLESANAYASVDDQALQLIVFNAELARTYGLQHEPRAVRNALASKTYPANIRQALYVGLDAYEAAGGRTDRDLWMGLEEGDRLLDPAILDRLARDKAEGQLQDAVDLDGFASGELVKGFAEAVATALPSTPRGFLPSPVAPHQAAEKLDQLLPPDKRGQSIGIYALSPDNAGLQVVGWWRPAKLPSSAVKPGEVGPTLETTARLDAAVRQISGAADADRAERTRVDRVRRHAAQMVVEASFGEALEGRAVWPRDADFIPAITDAPNDPDTVLVAVQILLPRAQLEGAIADAEKELGTPAPDGGAER